MPGAVPQTEAPRAIGRLGPNGPWIGFDRAEGTYRFIVGAGGRVLAGPADADLLIAVAIAHFAEALEGAPPDLEATQADLSVLVAYLVDLAEDARRRALLQEALDAIDDGLAGNAVAGLLAAARGPERETDDRAEPVDPVELLAGRADKLLRGR